MAVAPAVRGLYLCERVTTHPSRNLTLHECFRAMLVAGMPITARPFVVVAYLANGVGETTGTIRVRRLDNLDDIYRAEIRLTFPTRLTEVRFVGRVNQCVFPGPGEYEVALWVRDELLAQTPFTVHALEEGRS